MNILLIATAWGYRFGGINAFNYDLACALAEAVEPGDSVICAVLGTASPVSAQPKTDKVRVLYINKPSTSDHFDDSWVFDIHEQLLANHVDYIDWWIGHDLKSGSAAVRGAQKFGGRTALIHHMRYQKYKAFESDDGFAGHDREAQQRALFNRPAELFAVGPLLADSCREMTGREVTALVPGFPDALKAKYPGSPSFTAITYGRLGGTADNNKLGSLAVAAFSKAIKVAEASNPQHPFAIHRPTLKVIGASIEAKELAATQRLAEDYAGHAVNVLLYEYIETRADLMEHLSTADVMLMLSWHEGFGLSGWEAIGAGVPLVLSTHSGLFQLIKKELGGAGTGCLAAVNIGGSRKDRAVRSFTDTDVDAVARAILQIRDADASKDDANTLRDLLIRKLGCSWADTAKSFLAAAQKSTLPATGDERPEHPGGGGQRPSSPADAISPAREHVVRYHTKVEFFAACCRELEKSNSLRVSIVGPTFLEPDWWQARNASAEPQPDFSVALKSRLRSPTTRLADCEIILRNRKDIYVKNLREYVSNKSEWFKLVDDMMKASLETFGESGEHGPRIRCFDPGFGYLPHLFDHAALIGSRPAPNRRVSGGVAFTDREVVEAHLALWSAAFDGNSQTQTEAVQLLRQFIASLRTAYR